MNISDILNRGFNLLATSITALAGFAFAPEIFVETDWPDKIDDILLFILGLVALWWYKTGTRSTSRSVVPAVLVILALIVKFGGLLIELGDPDAMGDDLGGLILFILAAGLVTYQYRKTKRLLAEHN